MDALDRKILRLLGENARMTIKEIAGRVALTSPAVSERIRRMETGGVIAGYTVRLDPRQTKGYVRALISMYVAPGDREEFRQLLLQEEAVEECFQVTGEGSHMVKVLCKDIPTLELLVSRLQKLGQTNTRIILSTIRGGGALYDTAAEL